MQLYCVGTPKVVVAEGRLVSKNPKDTVNGLPLGTEFVKVLVERALRPNQELCLHVKNATTIGQAVRKFILWPKINVCILGLDNYKLMLIYILFVT